MHKDDRTRTPQRVSKNNGIIQEAELLNSSVTVKNYRSSLGNIGESIVLDQPGRVDGVARLRVGARFAVLDSVSRALLGIKGVRIAEI